MKYKILIILFLILMLRVFFTINTFDPSYGNKNVIGKITYIKKYDSKTIIDIKSKVNYRVTFDNKKEFLYGDYVSVSGFFDIPKNNTIFNLFNYRKYLLSKKIKLICNDCKVSLYKKNTNIFYKIKNRMYKRISYLKCENYIKTFILGNDSKIDDTIKESYQTNGIKHLFSISGMHLYIIILFINFLFKKLKLNKLILFMFLIFFIFLTGFKITLLRCSLYYLLKLLSSKYNMKFKSEFILLITLILLLIHNPYYIYDSSLYFSFIITFFILISNKLYIDKSYFKKLYIISFIAFLSSIPIISYFYYNINFLSIMYNIILSPFISFMIFPLCVITFLIPYFDNLCFLIIRSFEKFSLCLSTITFATVKISKPNFVFIAIYYIFLYLSLKLDRKYVIIIFLIIIVKINVNSISNNMRIVFLDVNQGDSELMVTKYGKSALIDTGGNAGEFGNYVEKRIIPYLSSIGLKKINFLVLTHGDFDHMGEAINLVNNFRVEKVVFNCGEFNDLEKELIKALDKKKIKYYSCIKELNIDNNKLYFLQTGEYDNENDNSNVIYTELSGYKFMFMGDAGIDKEKDILDKYNITDVDVLKVGHHGSKTSSSKNFINEINPKYSIISVGKNNRYGHPNKEVLNNLEDSKIYRTDQDGSIMFKIKNNELKIETCSP